MLLNDKHLMLLLIVHACWLACIELVGVVRIFCESVVLVFDGSVNIVWL